MLEARVKPTHFMNTVQAFSGREYVKTEWRSVPEEFEGTSPEHTMLDVREVGSLEAAPESVEGLFESLPESTEENAGEEKTASPRRTRRKKTEDE